VHDGQEQIRLIKSSISNAPVPSASAQPTSPRGRSTVENGHGHRNASPSKKVFKDPYTSLDTYWTQENENPNTSAAQTVIAPRAESFKPPPRDMSEIFAAGHEDNAPGSPKKSHAIPVVAPKAGSTSKFGPVRLFDEDTEPITSPKIYKTNPARYDHFDLGELPENDPLQFKSGGRPQQKAVPLTARTNKHASQWDFSDFTTPHKAAQKERPDDKVNFEWQGEDNTTSGTPSKEVVAGKGRKDVESNFEFEDDGTPVERKVIPKPRKDAKAHFEFDDQPTPAPARMIARNDAAKGLYSNVLDEDDRPLSNISNNIGRRKDFDNSWATGDDSSANSRATKENTGTTHNRNKSAQNMGASWSNYDQSPEQPRRPTSKGNRKVLEPQWGVNAEEEKPIRPKGGGNVQKGIWDF
jgi:hypothetical protein